MLSPGKVDISDPELVTRTCARVHNYTRFLSVACVFLIAGCAAYSVKQLEDRYGTQLPRERQVAHVASGNVDYWKDVKPILDQRCVVCHACYDAPCQLKLSSVEGLERGASPAVVYQQSRLNPAPTTRMFEDAQTVEGWRTRGFHPVLSEFSNTLEANREAGVMHRLLQLKASNPLPEGKVLPADFSLSLDRRQFCAKPETVDEYERKNPLWGMPYGLPAIEDEKRHTLLKWLEEGATYTPRPLLHDRFTSEVAKWEMFLNGDSLESQLSARYIYEHLFLGHLYFPELGEARFFRLVRSATPPGRPVEIIATRRPYNDPGVDRVYYRLTEEPGTVVAKTHMPYALDAQLLKRWREWFMEPAYTVAELPPYDEEVASNPFLTFTQLPAGSRYRFLLERAQFTIMSFIKGPVCRGQVALNVINDNFWVFFMNPDLQKLEVVEDFSTSYEAGMSLPASTESIYRPISRWRRYARQQKDYLAAMDAYLAEHYTRPDDMSLNLVWDGDGRNANAALTVFRHFDSATVEKGLVGQPPKTAWLVGYTLLERIHYLLVAGYDVYGNVGHQMVTRIYMDFLRMEGETVFLMLLPQEARDRERSYWYREAEQDIDEYMVLHRFEDAMNLDIEYHSDNEKLELYGMLEDRLAPALTHKRDLSGLGKPTIKRTLEKLESLQGMPANLMPQVTFVEVVGDTASEFVTLLVNDAHLNITSMFGEKKYRNPPEDTIAVVSGFLGTYPNVFLKVREDDLEKFVATIAGLTNDNDYSRLLDEYGIRRTSNEFWKQSDAIHAAFKQVDPEFYGLLDYNRFENR